MTLPIRLLAFALLTPALPAWSAACQPAADGALTAAYSVRYAAANQPALTQTWRLQREADRISWRKGDMEEIWLRQSSGVRLLRVFHADRQVVTYTPGELSALGVAVRWDDLVGLLPASRLAELTAQGARYSGTLAGEQVEVMWDAGASLPEQLVRRSDKGEVRFERTACTAGAAVALDFPGYGQIDAADFGDMESDPFVRKAMAYDERQGWREAHTH